MLASVVCGCTVICPAVGVIRGSTNADVATGAHPGPVSYPRTILENAVVGLLIDGALLTTLWATALYSTSDTAFRR